MNDESPKKPDVNMESLEALCRKLSDAQRDRLDPEMLDYIKKGYIKIPEPEALEASCQRIRDALGQEIMDHLRAECSEPLYREFIEDFHCTIQTYREEGDTELADLYAELLVHLQNAVAQEGIDLKNESREVRRKRRMLRKWLRDIPL